MGVWGSIGKALKGTAKYLGKGLSFIGKGIGKGFSVLKKAVLGVGSALGATAAFLGLGKKAESEGKNAQKGIEDASNAGDKKIEGVKAETHKMAEAPPSRPDPEAEADKRKARAEGAAAKSKLDAMEADLRVMDKLSAHTAEILRRYGSHAAKGMVAGMDMRKPKVSMSDGTNVLLGEQIRLMYEQKFNHRHGVFSLLSMVGAGNELLGVLSDQLKLIHAQGVTDANYDVIKSKVLETLATKAVADSAKANAVADKSGMVIQDALEELVALQKESNATQDSGTRPLLKKVGLGMVSGLAGLAGLMLASKYLGNDNEEEFKDEKDDEGGWNWEWPWENNAKERDDEEDRKNPDYIKDDGSLMSAEERNRVDEIKSEAALSGGAMGASTVIDGISAIKKGKAVASAAKTATEAVSKAGAKALSTEARKKFLKNLGPRAMKVIGTKIATKLGIKAATKGALKKVPVAGLLFSLFEAVPRIAKGDYTGASLAIGSGAASLLHAADIATGPGGSIAAISLGLAADGALALHDYNRAMEDLRTKGHSDLLDDDDLADVFMTPTEEEMKAAEEAEKKVKEEEASKTELKDEDGSGSDVWGKVADFASGVGSFIADPLGLFRTEESEANRKEASKTAGNALGKVADFASGVGSFIADPLGLFKGPLEGNKGGDKPKLADAIGAVAQNVKESALSFLRPGSPAPTTGSASYKEVSHGASGTWMGYGAKANYGGEGMGDLSECRSYPPETMERITNFAAYPPDEIDEGGDYARDVQGMISDLTNMQGTIKYSMEQRDIDKGIGDCSTFTRWAMKKYFGIDIGGNCDMQLGENLGKVVDYSGVGINGETTNARGPNISALKPGDLIYYSSKRKPWNAGRPFRISHVEMYIGNGKVIGQTTTKGEGQGFDAKGPWIHDINDKALGTFLAAKRYIGQTRETAKYAVDPSSVGARQTAETYSPRHGTKDVPRSNGVRADFGSSFLSSLDIKQSITPSQRPINAPVHTPTSHTSGNIGDAKSRPTSDASSAQGGAPVSIDNSSVNRGGDTYITNNNTTNIYTHEDGRGSSELQ